MVASFWSGGISGNTKSWLDANGTQTARSSAGTINSYTLPSATLDTDGDYFIVNWMFNITGGPPNLQARISLDGGNLIGGAFTVNNNRVNISVQIVRSGANTLAFSAVMIDTFGSPAFVITNGAGTLGGNWDSYAPILLGEISAYTSGTLTSNLWTVSLMTQ